MKSLSDSKSTCHQEEPLNPQFRLSSMKLFRGFPDFDVPEPDTKTNSDKRENQIVEQSYFQLAQKCLSGLQLFEKKIRNTFERLTKAIMMLAHQLESTQNKVTSLEKAFQQQKQKQKAQKFQFLQNYSNLQMEFFSNKEKLKKLIEKTQLKQKDCSEGAISKQSSHQDEESLLDNNDYELFEGFEKQGSENINHPPKSSIKHRLTKSIESGRRPPQKDATSSLDQYLRGEESSSPNSDNLPKEQDFSSNQLEQNTIARLSRKSSVVVDRQMLSANEEYLLQQIQRLNCFLSQESKRQNVESLTQSPRIRDQSLIQNLYQGVFLQDSQTQEAIKGLTQQNENLKHLLKRILPQIIELKNDAIQMALPCQFCQFRSFVSEKLQEFQ